MIVEMARATPPAPAGQYDCRNGTRHSSCPSGQYVQAGIIARRSTCNGERFKDEYLSLLREMRHRIRRRVPVSVGLIVDTSGSFEAGPSSRYKHPASLERRG